MFYVIAYPQIDTTVIGNEVIITETPEEIQPVVRKYKIPRLQNQYDRAESHRDYYQAIMEKLEWIMDFEPEIIVPDTTKEIIMKTMTYSPKAQIVLDYLGSIEDLSKEKSDIQELWKGYNPIQTSTVWRNATIKKWMDIYSISYKSYWTKAKLLEAVKKHILES